MKIRKLGKIIFFCVTLVVFFAGTAFTILNRYEFDQSISAKPNLLAIAGGFFLTVGELAFILLHALCDARELWRRITAYTLSLGLIGTITYATYNEALSYMQDRSVGQKKELLAVTTQENSKLAKTSRDRRQAIKSNETLTTEVLGQIKQQNFVPFAINFIYGLFCIMTATLIQPREPWKRRRGNVMTPELAKRIETKIGFVPDGATAYDDGKGSSVIIKKGREYITTLSKE